MVEQAPREYLTKVLELSRQMVELARIDPGHEMDLGCRMVFGALCDYGYVLKKMAEKELAAHGSAGASASEESSALAAISSPAKPKTVLIVDDDRDFLNYLSLLFRDNGFEALTAASGHEAVSLACARPPDLIALDISMPAKPGVAAYLDLARLPELAAIPVLLLTAVGESVDHFIDRCRQVPDPVAFVAKPLDVNLLWEAVREVLGAPSR